MEAIANVQAFTALGIGLGWIRRGEGCDQDDAVGGAERKKRLPCGAVYGGKVRPKHQAGRKQGKPFDEERNTWDQFGRTAGDVYGLDREPSGERNDRLHRLPGHDLYPARAGLEVAMAAPEIAQVPRVHLEGVNAVPGQGEPMAREGVGERLYP